jgi:dienelactone hydrolase
MNAKLLIRHGFVLWASVFLSANAYAYEMSDPWGEWSKTKEDLNWPTTPVNYGSFAFIENNLFSPSKVTDGAAQPAIILIHACNGITKGTAPDLRFWIKTLTEKGFYVLNLDQLAKGRGQTNCRRPRDVHEARLAKDIFDATEHLSKLPFINKDRIFTLGFSMGTMAGQLAASQSVYEKIAPGKPRPRAISGLYGGCQFKRKDTGWFKYLLEDSTTPMMLLMGAKDRETPYEDCVPLIQEIQKKVPQTQYHVYENATHCYDCQNMAGFSKTAGNGNFVRYEYNEEATKDSVRRLVDFYGSFK